MTVRIRVGGLQIAKSLWELVDSEICPGTGISSQIFWRKFEEIVNQLGPVNRALLQKREQIQQQIDEWHQGNAGKPFVLADYKAFLTDIGYLVKEGEPFAITTENIDLEITSQAGPQLVVPVKNARFALNAANARWGSLYDALYGTDAISVADGAEISKAYNPIRGAKVITFAKKHLDTAAPLAVGSHADVGQYFIEDQKLQVKFNDGTQTGLLHPQRFVGFNGTPEIGRAHV